MQASVIGADLWKWGPRTKSFMKELSLSIQEWMKVEKKRLLASRCTQFGKKSAFSANDRDCKIENK